MRTKSILTDEHLHAIGLVTAEWAEMEYYLHATIWALAEFKTPGQGNAITDHLRAIQLSHALESVAKDRFGESTDYDNIKDIGREIRRLYEQRNKYAHAKWQKDPSDGQIYRLNRRHENRLKAAWDAIDVDVIVRLAQQISDLTSRLAPIFFAHKPETWPSEPRRPSSQ